MASRTWYTLAGALLLAIAAWYAGAQFEAGIALQSWHMAGNALAATLALACIAAGLTSPRAALPVEVSVGVAQEHAELARQVLALESQLEFAPVALLRVDDARLDAVNVHARRLLAPGRASDLQQLHATLAGVAPGTRSVVYFDSEKGKERALATASALTVEGQPQRLLALMPMESELEAEAMQAWHKLVHVLTHEIMNSLTPVASLSYTSRTLLDGVRDRLPSDIADDLDISLDAIGRRADSLAHFVSGYRLLASVPDARPQRIVVADLCARLAALTTAAWLARGGQASFTVEPAALELLADPGQLEQALMNLFQNAADATAGVATPELRVSARLARGGRLRIEVTDNGPGVEDALLGDIFTPFFSTKSKGSGIGLSMVRQLVHRNGGAVRYARPMGGGACFVLTF